MGLWLALVLAAATSGPLDRALTLESQGDDAGALTAATEATRAQPAWALARLETGRLALKLGDLDRSRFELFAAQALAPENPRVQFLLGQLFEEKGETWRAAAAMERAVSFRSDYSDAHRALAAIYLSLKDPFRAELHLRAALAEQPGEKVLSLQLAEALEAQGRPDAALSELRLLHVRAPENPIITHQLAALLRRTGHAHDADALERPLTKPARTLRPLRPSRR